jgi:3-deoxy-manno-octulosonate cytidylyltransferase (CMP-KDO synthetase)
MSVVVLIPARLAATRLPDKPLLDLAGKTMIQRVYEQALRAGRVDAVAVATPDEAIVAAVAAFGGTALRTSAAHRTGTDRLAEAVLQLPDAEIIVNVQGDEPLIDPATIDAVAAPLLDDPDCQMASLCCPLPEGRAGDPNVVKVVCDPAGDALYFSRAPIPYFRSVPSDVVLLQHVGLYAYRRGFLLRFPTLAPTPLERAESLEQLRALENGIRIRMVRTERAPESVDTPEDLERVRALLGTVH